MNYAALQAEIGLPAYAGMTDAEIAAALNAETIPAVRDVPTSDARALLLATGEWGGIVMLARSAPSDLAPSEAIAAAITAEDTLRLTATLEVSKPAEWAATQTLVAAMQAVGVLSAETAAALLGLRDIQISRADELGLGTVRPGDVAMARIFTA